MPEATYPSQRLARPCAARADLVLRLRLVLCLVAIALLGVALDWPATARPTRRLDVVVFFIIVLSLSILVVVFMRRVARQRILRRRYEG
jgi:hypothetical protein